MYVLGKEIVLNGEYGYLSTGKEREELKGELDVLYRRYVDDSAKKLESDLKILGREVRRKILMLEEAMNDYAVKIYNIKNKILPKLREQYEVGLGVAQLRYENDCDEFLEECEKIYESKIVDGRECEKGIGDYIEALTYMGEVIFGNIGVGFIVREVDNGYELEFNNGVCYCIEDGKSLEEGYVLGNGGRNTKVVVRGLEIGIGIICDELSVKLDFVDISEDMEDSIEEVGKEVRQVFLGNKEEEVRQDVLVEENKSAELLGGELKKKLDDVKNVTKERTFKRKIKRYIDFMIDGWNGKNVYRDFNIIWVRNTKKGGFNKWDTKGNHLGITKKIE